MMKVKMIEKRQNGVCLFELQNDEIKVDHVVTLVVIFYLCSQKTEMEIMEMSFLDIKMWKIVIKMINF